MDKINAKVHDFHPKKTLKRIGSLLTDYNSVSMCLSRDAHDPSTGQRMEREERDKLWISGCLDQQVNRNVME